LGWPGVARLAQPSRANQRSKHAPHPTASAKSHENCADFEFVEFASPTPGVLEPVFERMGFTLVARHRSKDVVLYRQGDINFIVNREPKSVAGCFAAEHSACGVAFRLKDAHLA
jgi:4-hydroxyphenylpyruvate dioxygenase-like putative hemolysin